MPRQRICILDQLFDRWHYTRFCANVEEAKQEAERKIQRLCSLFNISKSDGRFYILFIEEEQ